MHESQTICDKVYKLKVFRMKKVIGALLMTTILTTSLPLVAREDIQELGDQTDQIYRTGAGAHDGAFTALGISILGWGVGLAVGIALLAAALNHGSGGSSAHTTTCH